MNIQEWIKAGKPINKVIQGDCIEGLKQLDDNSVDCIWIDPPYNINYKYNGYSDNLDTDDYQKMMETSFKEFYRILKDGKCVFIKQFWRNLPLTLKIGMKYFNFHNQIIWKNSSPAQPKTNFKPLYEIILMFTKGEIVYFNDKFETRKTQMPWTKSRTENYYGKISNLWIDIPNIYGGSIKHKEGIYKPGTNEKKHPAQHPIKLVTRCIGFVTKEKDIVLDCFMGSGTTAVACKQLNRNFIGFELSEEYCKIAEERLKQENLLNIFEKEGDE